MKRFLLFLISAFVALVGLTGCGRESAAPEAAGETAAVEPAGPVEVVLWHNQTLQNAEVFEEIAQAFTSAVPEVRIKLEYSGNYGQIYQKVMANIQAGSLPDMVVAYESMVSEYARANVVTSLDQYVADPEHGLSATDLADIFPAFLDTNRYPHFDNKMLSFPFCKSNLMMYCNMDMLNQAGIESPPRTWTEFVAACRAVKAKLGLPGYALSIDASTVNGMIFSRRGRVYDPATNKALYDSPESLAVFNTIDQLFAQKIASHVAPRSYDDVRDLASGRTAMILRTSATRPFVYRDGAGRFRLEMAMIPQLDPEKPVTVLFGPNICVFKTSPERQLASWRFLKSFASAEVTSIWAARTGYLPVRQSAATTEILQRFFSAEPINRRAFDALPYARPEPNVFGWQEVRALVERAETTVVTGLKSAQQAVEELAAKADHTLAEARDT